MKELYKFFVAAVCCCLIIVKPGITSAQSHTPKYTKICDNVLGFYEYLPAGYSTSGTTYPLLVFSHGLGELGHGDAASLPAEAGYPHLTVPMGLVKGLPVGLSFIGPKWSEQLLLNLGYAYEQARGPFPAPKFYRSIEESPDIAPALQPQGSPKSSQPETRELLISNMTLLLKSWDRDGDGRLSRAEVARMPASMRTVFCRLWRAVRQTSSTETAH